MDSSRPGSSVYGLLQAKIVEWDAMSCFRGSPHSGIKPASLMSPALTDGLFTTRAIWEALSLYILCNTL